MALGDGKAKQESQEIKGELSAILDAVSSIGDKLVSSFQDAVDEASKFRNVSEAASKTLKRGLLSDIKETVKNTEDLIRAQVKAEKGLLKQSEIQKLQNKLAENRVLFEARQTIALANKTPLTKAQTKKFEEQLVLQEAALKATIKANKENEKAFGLIGLTKSAITGVTDKIDKSGKLSKVFNGELNKAQKLTLLTDSAFALLVNGVLQASDNIAAIAKNTGVSANEAQRLQSSFATAASESGKLFINSKDLNKAFGELSSQTGLIADFGGETLVTQATLTKQLGLSAGQAGKLSLLSRIQGKDTENVLSNTVKTVGAISKQNGVALNAKSILNEISNASAAITVSLGKNPIALAEAASQAKLFGANLSTIDNIASSLLNFEESIANELSAELLIGKDINLEKARQAALNNDLAGLSKELANNEEIINSFSTGNRIQQEAAAAAIGLSRDQLAEIALQQEFNNLSAEQFRDTYGEVTYEQLQSQSASEKFASTLEAIQGIIGDIGIAFAPFLDGLATAVGFLAKNKAAAIGLAAVLTTLASISLANAVANIFASSVLTGPIAGPILAAATVAGMIAAIASTKTLTTADDMIAPPGYGDRILSTPKGSIALNNDDTVLAGTNLGGGGNQEAKRTNQLIQELIQYAARPSVFQIGTDEFYTATSKYSYQVQ
jgi:hypothetical protein